MSRYTLFFAAFSLSSDCCKCVASNLTLEKHFMGKPCKYLGVSLDSKLHFQPHINQIEIKVAKAVGILSKLRFLFPKSALILLYYSLIHPHLLYALPLWGSTFPTYLSKLQRLQNKALRIIFNSNQLTSATPLFHILEILKITDLYQFEISKLMYLHSKKIFSTLLPWPIYSHLNNS